MTLSALGIFSAAGAGGVVADTSFDLIESVILGTTQSSVVFSSLGTYSSTYKHLQIRMSARSNRVSTEDAVILTFNSDSGANYYTHYLEGRGSSVASGGFGAFNTAIGVATMPSANATANVFGGTILDILDVFSSTKNKTTRSLDGFASTVIDLYSGHWRSTASVTSISLTPSSGGTSFVSGSRFSLYGIKG
jgi:hypothetical protein